MCKAEKLNKDVFEDLPLLRRHDLCLSLFHCLNWFRELVSQLCKKNGTSCDSTAISLLTQVCAFAHETDPDMKGKVLTRLTNITQMQNQLESCMNGEGELHTCIYIATV